MGVHNGPRPLYNQRPLLADFSGAAAAYSLRSLTVGSPDVVRVRRSSDNAEANFTAQDVTSGALLTWVGTTASDDGFVVTWFDQSGNGNDATQATAASQPLIVDAGVPVKANGLPAIDFDGTDDFLSAADAPELEINDGTGSDRPFDIKAVVTFNNTSVVNPIVCKNVGLDEASYAIYSSSNNLQFLFFLGTGSSSSNRIGGFTSLAATNGDTFLTNCFYDGSASFAAFQTYQNGIQTPLTDNSAGTYTASLDSAAAMDIGRRLVFSTQYLGGQVSELIIYPSDQSSNRSAIEQNIADYYGITLS